MGKMNKFVTSTALGLTLALTACSKTVSNSESELETKAFTILSQMTLEEKIGQVIQADISAVTPEEAREYNLGSVLNGGNSAPGGKKIAMPEAWIALADDFWIASTDKSDGGLGIPLLWGTDAVHGHNNLQSAAIFPHNIGLGATNNPSLIKEIGDITAREIRATGLDWTFAPTLAVAQDDRWGRTYESYSENPDIVATYSKAMVEGLQGGKNSKDFLQGDNVIATAKHFVADGGTQFGIDKGDTIGSVDDILKMHGAGYQPAFDAGVQTVMASFSSINGKKMHGSKELLTDVLRGEMGFDGFVVGDWNGHAEVPGCTATDCPSALEAGIDMYMAPDSWRGLYDSLLGQAKSGELSMDSLDQAVTHILRVKLRSGLFEAGLPSARATSNPNVLGTSAHGDVAQQAVRESLVLLKNENDVLPLNPSQTILVTGSGADSMQQQTGGWTLNWQGDGNKNDIFETGETIYAGIKSAMTPHGGKAILSQDGKFDTKPDVAVVVFGEQPYAEFKGDKADVIFEFEDGENLALLKRLKAQNIPVVSVFLTGRPLWTNTHINASDAFAVAWLPGTEGAGVADVLVGDANGNARHDFKGRLSFTWPANGSGNPVDKTSGEAVQFPYGYGLSYKTPQKTPFLSEESGVVTTGNSFDGTIIEKGDAAKPFAFYLGDSSNLNTPAAEFVSSSLGGTVTTRGVDFKAQEDAREITWNGSGKANAYIRSRRAVDLSAEGNNVLSITWRMDEAPNGPMQLSMGCGDGCGAEIDITSLASSLPKGQWTTTQIPVACFTAKGLETSHVNQAFNLITSSKARLTLHAAALETTSKPLASCPK